MKAEKEFLYSVILGALSEANERHQALPEENTMRLLQQIALQLERPEKGDMDSAALYLIFAELLAHLAILIEKEVEHLIVSQN